MLPQIALSAVDTAGAREGRAVALSREAGPAMALIVWVRERLSNLERMNLR